jgi:protein O-GlcNAc transferase
MATDQAFEKAFDEAVQHTQQGRLEDAADAWMRASALAPERPDVYYNLGNTLKKLDRAEDAINAFRRSVDLDPSLANAHYNLAGVLKDMGRLEDAADAYRNAIRADPGDAEAHMNLGNTLDLLGDGEAKACYLRAIDLSPNLLQAHDSLGRIAHERGDLAAALKHYQNAIALDPDFTAAHANLATVYRKISRLDDAEASCRRALELDGSLAGAHVVLGNVHMVQGEISDAAACFKRAIALDADLSEAHSDLGNALTDLRDLDGALKAYQTAIPSNDACKNYLLTLLYQPGLSNDDLFERYRETVENPAPAPAAFTKPGERLRIGYVSSDFRYHPIGNNILPLLANHDHGRVEVFCYAHVMTDDLVTKAFQNHADHWRVVNAMTDAELAETLRGDGIDVAVYLGGHFDENRPGAASHRSSPVQVAMHGGSTTAMDSMDYWLTDDVLHPEGEGDGAERFTETLWRLPNFYAFTPPSQAPEVSPLPADENGYVTFVSFNKPCKMNDGVLDVWSGVLAAVPEARLLLKFRNHLDDAAVAGPMRERLATNGISQDRVEMIASHDDIGQHLAHYHRGDIALDPFPFSGATTTFQALWMGLPVVSLYTERFIGRMGASISHHAGLGDLAAVSPGDYIDACASLAGNLDRLRNLRQGLRGQVAASPLCDGAAYARNVEDAFYAMVEKAGGDGG